jgi:hypothetical protein
VWVDVLAQALVRALPDLVVERHLRHRRAVGRDPEGIANRLRPAVLQGRSTGR